MVILFKMSSLCGCAIFLKWKKLVLATPGTSCLIFRKNQRMIMGYWFVRSDFGENTVIRSSKCKLGAFTRKVFTSTMFEARSEAREGRSEVRDLFKTF